MAILIIMIRIPRIHTALDDDIEHLPAVQSLAALMLFLSAIYYKHVMSNIFILC